MRQYLIPVVASLVLLVVGGCKCGDENEANCKAVKPGTIVSVNKVCAVENDDPVDPSVTPAEWKGQKIGFCCKGCIKKWEAMTPAQKDEAVAKAVALSK